VTEQTDIQYPRSLAGAIVPRPVCGEVSIVIPTLGRDILETCLAYIADGSCWPAQLIVVDQGRQPAVEAMLARLEAAGLRSLYLPSTQRGRSAGINRGLERVATRFVTITDDDCFVSADWLETLAERLRREPGTIWTGRVEAAGHEVAFSTVLSRTPQRHTRPQLRVHPFVGGNVGMAMDVVRRIGGFDEHPCLASAEDSDYGYRALRLGITIAYDPDVVLYHYHWRDEGERASRYADYARSQGGFYGTHLRRGDLLVLVQVLRAAVRSPLRWVRGVLGGNAEMARNGRISTLNLLPGILAGFKRRHAPLVSGDLARSTERS
jgi:GT2 family glycosyltransferase